jgi:hypothetical protein
VLLTVALMLSVERHLFSTASVAAPPPTGQWVEKIRGMAAVADKSQAAGSWWLSLRDHVLRTVTRTRSEQLPLRVPSHTAL